MPRYLYLLIGGILPYKTSESPRLDRNPDILPEPPLLLLILQASSFLTVERHAVESTALRDLEVPRFRVNFWVHVHRAGT